MKIFATPRTQLQMQNRPTAYEVCAYADDRKIARLGFTERKTKAVLLTMAQDHGEFLLEHMSKNGQETTPTYSRKKGWRFGNVTIEFTGFTERDFCDKG